MEAQGTSLGSVPSHAARAADRTFVTVTDLARELGITARALRFYEDKGLIAPHRVSATRIYAARERARMILILRGKRLGFSLREIKDYLDLYDADPRQETQTLALLERIGERRVELEDNAMRSPRLSPASTIWRRTPGRSSSRPPPARRPEPAQETPAP